MKRSVYTGLHYLMMPLVVGRLKWLARKNPDYSKNLGERFGRAEPCSDHPIWIHAVSVGETIAAEPLVRRLQAAHPEWRILMTSTTPTGADQVRRLYGETVTHQYAPYDLPGAIDRFLEQVKPRALVVMETELWPNWMAAVSRHQIPVMIANARLSEKSAAGYARLGSMSAEMMGSLDMVAAQYGADARRFIELGVSESCVKVVGNIKADIQVEAEDRQVAEAARAKLSSPRSPTIVAASTHPGEEEIILDAFSSVLEQQANALLYLVPRHPVRASEVQELLDHRGIKFIRRSDIDQVIGDSVSVVLGDRMGELRGLMGAADMVIMGGTLVDHGGHNPLEPAIWKCPVIAGPSQRNFDSLFNEMEKAGALVRVDKSAAALSEAILALVADENRRQGVGQAALNYLESQRGAADRLLVELETLIS